MWTKTILAPAMALTAAVCALIFVLTGLYALKWEIVIMGGMFFIAQLFIDGGGRISRVFNITQANASKSLFWFVVAALAILSLLGGIYIFPKAARQSAELYDAFMEFMRLHLPPDIYGSLQQWDLRALAAQVADWEVFVRGKELFKSNPDTVGAAGQAVTKIIHFAIALPREFLHFVLLFVGAYYIMEREDPWRAEGAYAVHPPQVRSAIGLSVGMLRDSYKILKSFVLGQIIVCLSASIYYMIGLALVGVKAALALGLFAGMISFIPIIGTFLGLISITSAAYIQSQDPILVVLVAAIFQLGHFIEAKIMIPRVVGARVGLSPLVALLALLFGMKLGIVGMVVAVPVAGILRVAALHLLPEASALWKAYYGYTKNLFT